MAFVVLPPRFRTWEEAARRLARAVNAIADGRSNATGQVTLTPHAGETVVADARAGTDSAILLTPLTSAAAAAAGGTYVAVRGQGSFTLAHADSAAADRTFAYAIQG